MSSHLSNQAREHKDTNEEVGHLKGNLKGGYRFWETPDVDETADSKVVTTQVPAEENSSTLLMDKDAIKCEMHYFGFFRLKTQSCLLSPQHSPDVCKLTRRNKYIRCSLPIVHPRSRCQTLMYRGHVEGAGVEMQHEEQVAGGASHSESQQLTVASSITHAAYTSLL